MTDSQIVPMIVRRPATPTTRVEGPDEHRHCACVELLTADSVNLKRQLAEARVNDAMVSWEAFERALHHWAIGATQRVRACLIGHVAPQTAGVRPTESTIQGEHEQRMPITKEMQTHRRAQ